MKRFILSSAAARDLNDIWDFIAEHSVAQADRVCKEIYKALRALAAMPEMGHLREDLTEEPFRFWTVYNYHIVYRAGVKPIEIIRIIHGARNIEGLF